MNHVLLLGAGFSRNWNGWLAEEIIGDLLGRLEEDIRLSNLVRGAGGYEAALSQIQSEYKSQQSVATKEHLDRLQDAILETFGAMNRAFAAIPSMEVSNEAKFSILRFLSKFDAIFTLNQDLLLELHYNIETHACPRWNGHYFPGMEFPPNWTAAVLSDRLGPVWHPAAKFHLEPKLQPIFKLHGSVNWRDSDDGQLLVMGGNKPGVIQEKQILNSYIDYFRDYLKDPNTRLMVIGYSFSDDHINRIIYEAWQTSQLRMFIVDPRGLDVFNKHPRAVIRVPDPIEEIQIIGLSRRPLTSSFGNDQFEHGKLMRFFH